VPFKARFEFQMRLDTLVKPIKKVAKRPESAGWVVHHMQGSVVTNARSVALRYTCIYF